MSEFDFSPALLQLARQAEEEIRGQFAEIEEISARNTAKVLKAFSANRVSDACFAGTAGYGYDDLGRDKLELIYAQIFGAEKALVRHNFVNGTHALTAAMFACVSSGDVFLSATGNVYDTLQTVTGQRGKTGGTFADYNIEFRQVPLAEGLPDLPAIEKAAADPAVKAVFIQRSRGYARRQTLSCRQIEEICQAVRRVNPHAAILTDNCYGEFVEETEPTQHGADLIAGSLIKNPGGGLAPSGGYVAGRGDLVERAAYRLTAPGIGGECGASLGVNRSLYQGLFLAPHVVSQAVKTAAFAAALLERLGCQVSPRAGDKRFDIIQTVEFGAPEPLLAFCRGIQAGAPVDAFATPEPWDMPGYDCPVVMAAGAFIQGSSIELSCDGPMRPPYIGFLQGGLTYEAGKLGVMAGAKRIMELQDSWK